MTRLAIKSFTNAVSPANISKSKRFTAPPALVQGFWAAKPNYSFQSGGTADGLITASRIVNAEAHTRSSTITSTSTIEKDSQEEY